MANVQNRIILSSLVFVFVALSACSKHGARNQIVDDKKVPATSTAADPAKAVADNKKADDAARAAAAEAAKAGEKPAADPAEAGAAAADRGDALDKAVSLFAGDKKTATSEVGTPTGTDQTAASTATPPKDETGASAKAAATAMTAATTATAQATVTPVVPDTKMIASGTAASAPAATAEEIAAEVKTPVVTAETAVAVKAATEDTGPKEPIQLPAVTVTGASRATRLAFVKAMIQPTMELNNAIARQQIVINQLQKNAAAKPLSEADIKILADLQEQYGLTGSATFADLLARVDMVSMPFLIAKFARENNWKANAVTVAMLGERVKFLNTDAGPEAAGYRAARIAVKAHDPQYRSWAIMVGVQHRTSDPDTLPEVVLDINELSQDPSIPQEIARVRTMLESQIPTP